MLHSDDLLKIATMPSWSDISLALYKEFSEKYLIPTTFRYYLENGTILDVYFTEWSVYHILGIQHINGKISKTKFFEEIDAGLDFDEASGILGGEPRFLPPECPKPRFIAPQNFSFGVFFVFLK